MVAPNDFENLQSVYLRVYNKMVRETFRDDIPENEFSTPESQMRYACLIKNNDTAAMMQLRSNLFLMIREEAKRLQPSVYGIPTRDYHEQVIFRPQVLLRFEESKESAKSKGTYPKRVRASFRMMGETSETITTSKVEQLRRSIASTFPRTYLFKTGRIKMSYKDKPNGLELIVAPYTEAEGKQFVSKILSVAQVEPDWDRLSVSKHTDKNFNTQKTVRILGETQKLPLKRRTTHVTLRKAELKIHGNLEDISLYETY